MTVLGSGRAASPGYVVQWVYLHATVGAEPTNHQWAWLCWPREQGVGTAWRLYHATVLPWSRKISHLVLASHVCEPCPRQDLASQDTLVEQFQQHANGTQQSDTVETGLSE